MSYRGCSGPESRPGNQPEAPRGQVKGALELPARHPHPAERMVGGEAAAYPTPILPFLLGVQDSSHLRITCASLAASGP